MQPIWAAGDGRYTWFTVCVAIWAFSIWLSARVLLGIRFPAPPSDRHAYNFWRRHLSRALGALAFGVVSLASFRICRPPLDQEEPPLGWALSEAAQRTLKDYLGATPCPGNLEALINIQHWLKG